jgi:transcriptional regulator with XRE-family HTH domain
MGLEKINTIKKLKAMTSAQLSKESKVPLGTLNKILNGQTRNPTYEVVSAIARTLGCTVDDFADNSQEDKDGKSDATLTFLMLSRDEKDILVKYRQLSAAFKEDIHDYVDMKFAKSVSASEKIDKYPSPLLRY